MRTDINSLLIVFDEILTNLTNEELGSYWLKATRSDGIIVTLFFSTYENYAGVIVSNNSHIAITSVQMENCSEIRILDEKKKSLEIIHDGSSATCVVDLTGNTILRYDEENPNPRRLT